MLMMMMIWQSPYHGDYTEGYQWKEIEMMKRMKENCETT
jgi:hypothetical protein